MWLSECVGMLDMVNLQLYFILAYTHRQNELSKLRSDRVPAESTFYTESRAEKLPLHKSVLTCTMKHLSPRQMTYFLVQTALSLSMSTLYSLSMSALLVAQRVCGTAMLWWLRAFILLIIEGIIRNQTNYLPIPTDCDYFTGQYFPNNKVIMINFLQGFVCGHIGGVANVVSGYILDTLKVRMQMDPGSRMWQTLKSIVHNEGFFQLFNGIYYPLWWIPLVNAVVFSSYEVYKSLRCQQGLSFIDGFENGAFAGFIVTIVVAPVELIKCVMQNDKANQFRNSRHCMRQILQTNGVKGLFKGSFSTAARQIPSYGVQFATYEYLKDTIQERQGSVSTVQMLVIGPIAAVNSWLVSYPQDVIKTKIQVEKAGSYRNHRFIPDGGFFDCGRKIYRNQGLKGFLIGIEPCLLRGAIADGIGMVVYDDCQRFISKQRKQA